MPKERCRCAFLVTLAASESNGKPKRRWDALSALLGLLHPKQRRNKQNIVGIKEDNVW